MSPSLVSIIIPAYNASLFIKETLKSILSQTYSNIEVIVVDDGSTDNTSEVIKSFEPKVQYVYQKNSGSCAVPRNNGLSHASGEYVTFFDADDLMRKDKIEKQVQDLLDYPDAVASIADYWNFSESEIFNNHFSSCPILLNTIEKSNQKRQKMDAKECRKILLEENFSIASSPLFRMSIIKEISGFDQTLKACEDFHLIYRVATRGHIVINSETGFDRRLHDTNMSSDKERMLRNLIKSRELLINEEQDESLKLRLIGRVRSYNRGLLSCLLDKGHTEDTLWLLRETLPPQSLSEMMHDIKQLMKFTLVKLKLIRGTATS
jgi:glycosyltransferase involved in cell wall biosynthesis